MWTQAHKLALCVASLLSTAVFGVLILTAGIAGFAFSIAYIAVIGTISLLLRLS